MIGEAISFVLSFFVSGVGVVKALRILDLLRECKVLSKVCIKVADKAIASKEALAKTLEAAAEAISTIKNVISTKIDELCAWVSDIRRVDGGYEFVTDAGIVFRETNTELGSNINKIEEIKNGLNSAGDLYKTQKRIIDKFSHLTDAEKKALKQRAFEKVIEPEKWTGKIEGVENFIGGKPGAAEFRAADKMLKEGKNVKKLADNVGPNGELIPGPDFKVNGRSVELKTPNSLNVNTISDKVVDALSRQSNNVLVNGIESEVISGVTEELAQSIISEIKRKLLAKGLPLQGNVEIWLKDGTSKMFDFNFD
jgi:hypothetical protein